MCDIFCRWACFVTINYYDGIGVVALNIIRQTKSITKVITDSFNDASLQSDYMKQTARMALVKIVYIDQIEA